MKKELTIVAQIESEKDKIELFVTELLKLIKPTHEKKGRIQYYFHQSNDQPEIFIFYKNWESREFTL